MNGITLQPYGLLISLGLLVGYFLTKKRLSLFHLSEVTFGRVFWSIGCAALLGARLYHVIDYRTYYALHPNEVFQVWHGGLAIYGALLGGLIGLLIGLYRLGLIRQWLIWSDVLAPGVLLAQAIGRWGNFLNQEAFGPPTNAFWGIYIRPDRRPIATVTDAYYQPLFLYESVWSVLGVYLLLKFIQPGKQSGKAFGFYLFWYGLGRLILEGYRHDTAIIDGIHIAAVFSLIAIITGSFFVANGHRSDKPHFFRNVKT
jgi:phosphatidylglycerol:prolipoprotein diacylglycerol transferase